MRLRAKTDANHAQIVKELRQMGATVLDLSRMGRGCPDILVGVGGHNFAFEIKDGNQPPSKKKLTEDEKAFHEAWNGQVNVIEDAKQAAQIIRDTIAAL